MRSSPAQSARTPHPASCARHLLPQGEKGTSPRLFRKLSKTSTPSSLPGSAKGARRTLVIACGALAREVAGPELADRPRLPARQPAQPARAHPRGNAGEDPRNRASYDEILCLYGDCGTGGELDRVLEEEGVRAHRRAALLRLLCRRRRFRRAGRRRARHVLPDRLPRPALRRAGDPGTRPRSLSATARRLFRRYKRVVYLAQVEDPETTAKAAAAAARLGLAFERRFTGLQGVASFLGAARETPTWQA